MVDLSGDLEGTHADTARDFVQVAGTSASDRATLSMDFLAVKLTGPSAQVQVNTFDSFDELRYLAGDGIDTLSIDGHGDRDTLNLSAESGMVRIVDPDSQIVMHGSSVEKLEVHAYGGADDITVTDMSTAGVQSVTVDLALSPGGTVGDKLQDQVSLYGGTGDEKVVLASGDHSVGVTGMSQSLLVTHADAGDWLTVHTSTGNDTLDASKVAVGVMELALDGGDGNDTVIGSAGNDAIFGDRGNDLLIAGAGDDNVYGGRGDDIVLLGAGNDVYRWFDGDGNDALDGQEGSDTVFIEASDLAESISAFASNGVVHVNDTNGAARIDMNGVETLTLRAMGGADTVIVGDMSGTGVKTVNVDLSGNIASTLGDGTKDTVFVSGTGGDDHIALSIVNGTLVVSGLPDKVVVHQWEFGDEIHIQGLGGNDTIDASALGTNGPRIFLDGGAGDDLLTGTGNADLLFGDSGNDSLFAGGGDDTLFGNAGTDHLFGGDGNDFLDGGADFDVLDGGSGVNTLINA